MHNKDLHTHSIHKRVLVNIKNDIEHHTLPTTRDLDTLESYTRVTTNRRYLRQIYRIIEEVERLRKLSTIQKREKLNNTYAIDDKGTGGANHTYAIYPIDKKVEHEPQSYLAQVHFQNGARKEEGSVHGVLDTDLLEIVRDRLKGFQSGPFATRENACALTHIEEALMWMNRRVEDRIERDVLGTNKK